MTDLSSAALRVSLLPDTPSPSGAAALHYLMPSIQILFSCPGSTLDIFLKFINLSGSCFYLIWDFIVKTQDQPHDCLYACIEMMTSFSSSRTSRKAVSLSQVFYKNAVYFPNYRLYQGDTPGDLNYSCISTVYYCFANVASDGGVFVSENPLAVFPRRRLTPVDIVE